VTVKVGHNYSDCCAFEGGSPSFVGLLSQSPLTDTMAVRVGVRQWSFGTSQKLDAKQTALVSMGLQQSSHYPTDNRLAAKGQDGQFVRCPSRISQASAQVLSELFGIIGN
jgi:hypothetical protein